MRGLADSIKRRAIFDKHRFNADMLILQETHSIPDVEKIWENEWGGKAIYSHGTGAARGVAIFTSKKIYGSLSNIYKDLDGRLIIVDLEHNGITVSIAALYAPNEDSPSFFQEIDRAIMSRGEHKIIIGDFNLTLNVELDRQNTYCNNNRAKIEVENMMDKYCLKEIWRVQNQEKREFSWIKRGQGLAKASRIDFALVTGGLDQNVTTTTYVSSICTDHRGLYIAIELGEFPRGRGFWKLNTSLLQDQEYINLMNIEIERTLFSSVQKNPLDRWEILKKRIKESSIEYSSKKKSVDTLVIGELSEKVNEYESRLPLNQEEDQMLQRTKADLEEKTFERIKGVMFRSKVKWYEEGEKNSVSIFLLLRRQNINAKTCYKIIQ